jgi:transposase-like protein
VTLGVRANREHAVRDLRPVGQESAPAWQHAIDTLGRRGLRAPVLAVIDGNLGLHTALGVQSPGITIQRCTVYTYTQPAAA